MNRQAEDEEYLTSLKFLPNVYTPSLKAKLSFLLMSTTFLWRMPISMDFTIGWWHLSAPFLNRH